MGGICRHPDRPDEVEALVNGRFDDDGDDVLAFELIRPTQLWANDEELAQNGVTLQQVADFIAGLTAEQVARNDYPLASSEADDLVYETAFPSSVMSQLPCVVQDGG